MLPFSIHRGKFRVFCPFFWKWFRLRLAVPAPADPQSAGLLTSAMTTVGIR